jgi:general secretion pathway protein D
MRSNTIPSVLLALVVAGTMHGRGQAQDAPSAAKPAEKAAELPAVAPTAPPTPAVKEAEATPPPPETPPMVVPEGMLMLNFRGAPLETVLNYLSEAAGYIIVTEAEVRGKLDVIAKQPVTKEEAFTILESALARNGYTALRNGRTLTIVSKEGARKRDIPVKSGNDPEAIPKDEQMVTQIIPVRFISATQLTTDLQPLLPSEATMTANDAGNALVITDTQASIRRLTEIIRALDTSLAGAYSVKVYPLQYADAKELAAVIKELYPAQDSRSSGGNTRGGFGGGGFPGGFPGGFGGNRGGGGGASSSGSGNRAAASRVVAVADEHSNSIIINAPDDAMPSIEELIRSVDTNVQDVTELRVFRLQHADPVEMSEVLAGLFPDPTTSTDSQRNQRFGGGFGMFGGNRGGGGATTTSDRAKKKGKVITVPDQRTSSIIVSADHEMMDQIAEMVKQLDANPARKQKVYVYDLQNADPQQVQEVLRGLFESQNTQNRSTQNRNQNSALTTRSTQQQQQNNNRNTGGGFGGGGGGTGGGTGGGFGR